MATQKVSCAICGSTQFRASGTRLYAFCNSCGAPERARFLWLFLNRCAVLKSGMRVLHCAPEKALSPRLKSLLGPGYVPADFAPDRYSTNELKVEKLDLTDLSSIPDGSFDIVMHLHVLEHLPVPLEGVLRETMRILKPKGRFIFGLPITAGASFENLWPDTTPEDRTELFGQHDHVRLVGRSDFPRFLARIMGPFTNQENFRVDPSKFLSASSFFELTGLTFDRACGYTGDTIFDVQKDEK